MKQIFNKKNKYGHKVYQLIDTESPQFRRFDFEVKTKDLSFSLQHSYKEYYDPRYWGPDERTFVILKQRSNNTHEQEELITLYRNVHELKDSSAAQAREFPNYKVIPELLFAFQYYISNKEQLLTKTKSDDIDDKYIKDVFIENISKACKSENSNNEIVLKSAKDIFDHLFGENAIDIDKAIESQVDEQLKIMESKETQRLEEMAEQLKKQRIKDILKNPLSAFKLALQKRKANNNNLSKNDPDGPSI